MSSNDPNHPPPHSASESKRRQPKRPNTNNNNNDTQSNGFSNNACIHNGSDIELPSLADISIDASATDTSNEMGAIDWFSVALGRDFFENSGTATTNNNSAAASSSNDNDNINDDNNNDDNNNDDNNNDDNNNNDGAIVQAALQAAEAAGASLLLHAPNDTWSAPYFITEDPYEDGNEPITVIGAVYSINERDSEGNKVNRMQHYFSARANLSRPSFGMSATFRPNCFYHRTANGGIPQASYYYHQQKPEEAEIVSFRGEYLTVPAGYVLSCHDSDIFPFFTDNERKREWSQQQHTKAYTLYVDSIVEEESSEEESSEEESVSDGEDAISEKSITKKRSVLAIVPNRRVITRILGSHLSNLRNYHYLDDDNTSKTVHVKFERFKEGDGHIGMVTTLGTKILLRPFLVQSTYSKSIGKLNKIADFGEESAKYVS